jgi:hypothetical protein
VEIVWVQIFYYLKEVLMFAKWAGIMHRKGMMTASLLVAVATLGFSASANALPCSQGFVNGGGAPNYSCQDGGSNVSNDNASELNNGSYFGENTWEFLSKQDTPGSLTQPVDIDLVVSPTTGTQSGTWSFNAGVWDSYDQILIVIKDGKTSPNNVFWSAYLVNPTDSSGNWDLGQKSLSHLSVYGIQSVPEASATLLLSIALGGVAFLGRKKLQVRA